MLPSVLLRGSVSLVTLAARAAGAFITTGAILTLDATGAARASLTCLLTAALAITANVLRKRRAALLLRTTLLLLAAVGLATLLTNKLTEVRAEGHAGHTNAQTDDKRPKQTKKTLHVFLLIRELPII